MDRDAYLALLSDVAQRALALVPDRPGKAVLAALFAELEVAFAALQVDDVAVKRPESSVGASSQMPDAVAEVIRWSEVRFRTAAYQVSDSIYEVDLASGQTMIYGGEPYAQQGLELATLNVSAWEALLHPDDRDRVLSARQELLLYNRPFREEYRIVLPDGAVRFLADRSVVLTQPDGCRRQIGVTSDVSERVAAERRMLEAQRLESLGLMAGGIAHDFNNLLTGILGHAEIALEGIPPDAPARASLSTAIRSVHNAAELTGQLLAYAGKGRFVIQALDLNSLVRDTVELLRHTLVPSVQFVYQLVDQLPAVQADQAQIRQVVLNLLTNAVEAVGAAGGTITLTTSVTSGPETTPEEPGSSQLGDTTGGAYIHLEVRDTGCGMDAATQARIFDPFFTTKFTGRGLGLAAVQGIVQAHKGILQVESAPGAGSTFRLWLPIESARRASRSIGTPRNAPSRGALSGVVLVIDDDESVRAVSRLLLERMGFTTEGAVDGNTALEALARGVPGLSAVLLDLTMPDLPGAVVAQRMRERWPKLPIVLMSGYHSDEIAQTYADLRLDGFVQKPFSYDTLHAALAAALQPPQPRAG